MSMKGQIFHERYEILEKLGSGGTAIIYKARDQVLGRLVTIKILQEQYANDQAFVEYLRHEAQAVARLSHPNIVRVYDVVFTEESHYIVMEYIEGQSLKQYIAQNGPLPVEEALEIAKQILDALQHAHNHNIVHRDIKPHNILLDVNKQVKVTDFGIAVALTGNTKTYSGDVVGSVHYMAPEQVKGGAASKQSDLYSAGVVIYEMLTGKRPFDGENAIGVAMQHLEGEITPPHKLRPEISLELSAIIMRSLRKNPALRYSSAGEMRDNLDQARLHLSTGENNEEKHLLENSPKGKKRLSFTSWIFIIIAVVVLGAVGIFFAMVMNFVSDDEDVTVPGVTGITLEEAILKLDEQGLSYSKEMRSSSTVEENYVISQSIAKGQVVKSGRVIDLIVSSGPELCMVPDVVSLSQREASLLITNRLLRPKIVEVEDESAAAGTVVRQSPDPDTKLPESSEVQIFVSKGVQVDMPDLQGMTFTQAKAELSKYKLLLGSTSRKESNEYVADVVIGQSVTATTKVSQGSSIDLVLSDGPGPLAKTARVTYTLPQGDTEQHIVRIVIIDDTGSHEEYRYTHSAGDTISTDVPFYGKGQLQILVDDNLVFSENLS